MAPQVGRLVSILICKKIWSPVIKWVLATCVAFLSGSIAMENLPLKDITSLFVVIDDVILRKEQKVGRPSALSDSEMLSILIWCTIVAKLRTMKDIYRGLWTHRRYGFSKAFEFIHADNEHICNAAVLQTQNRVAAFVHDSAAVSYIEMDSF